MAKSKTKSLPAYSDLDENSRSGSPPPPYSPIHPSGTRVYERTPLLPKTTNPEHATRKAKLWTLLTRSCNFSGVVRFANIAIRFLLLALSISILGSLAYLIFSYLRFYFSSPPLPTYSVAIIGAGPAGIAAAQQLKYSATARNVRFDVTLYETAPRVGGQLALTDSKGGPVFPHDDPLQDPITAEDTAGAALLYNNALFTKDSEAILGDKVEFAELGSQQVKYYSGENLVTETTRPYKKTPTMSWLGLILRYGSAVWQAGGMTRDGNLRGKITNVPLSTDIETILRSLGAADLARQWATDQLNYRGGIGESYRTEVLEPQIRRTLGQKLQYVSGLALIMAAAQEDMGNSFSGGDLVERLERVLHTLDINLRMESQVTELKHEPINEHQSAWLVKQEGGAGIIPHVAAFDKVILATYNEGLARQAMLQANEHDKDADEVIDSISGLFKPAHVTFFTSTKRSEVWGGGNNEQILFLDADGKEVYYSGVHEFALVRGITSVRADGGTQLEFLYRLLSDDDVTRHLSQDPAVTWVYQQRIENAYSYLLPMERFPQVKALRHGLWCTSVINTIGNTVDLNWLAGKIVAQDLIREAVEEAKNK